jgi:hypothetical protein
LDKYFEILILTLIIPAVITNIFGILLVGSHLYPEDAPYLPYLFVLFIPALEQDAHYLMESSKVGIIVQAALMCGYLELFLDEVEKGCTSSEKTQYCWFLDYVILNIITDKP